MGKKTDKAYEAFTMSLRGYSVKEISTEIEVDEPTIKRWITARQEEVKRHVESVKGEDYLGIVLSRFEELRKLAYDDYKDASRSTDRARFLRVLMDIQKMEISTLQDLGALSHPVSKHDHKHEVKGGIVHAHVLPEKIDGAELESLSAILVADTMGITPEEALRLGGRYSDPDRPYIVKESDPRAKALMEPGEETAGGSLKEDVLDAKVPLMLDPLKDFDREVED